MSTREFTKRERTMLLVALDNLIVDYVKAGERARRRKAPATEEMCRDAAARYRRLAAKVLP